MTTEYLWVLGTSTQYSGNLTQICDSFSHMWLRSVSWHTCGFSDRYICSEPWVTQTHAQPYFGQQSNQELWHNLFGILVRDSDLSYMDVRCWKAWGVQRPTFLLGLWWWCCSANNWHFWKFDIAWEMKKVELPKWLKKNKSLVIWLYDLVQNSQILWPVLLD